MIYLAMIESGFNQIARSRVGAVGMWQFMPSTARRYGLTVDAWVDQRRDPFAATTAAIRFLSELNDRFGSWYLAAAAYDAGPGKIQRGLDRGDFGALNGNDAYFAMAAGHFLRRETRDYVPKLIAAALIAKEPARYGFTGIAPWSPLRYDSVRVDNALGLNVLARLSGAASDEIEEMNPAFFRLVTPPDRAVWVRVPRGAGDSVAARLTVLPAKDRVTSVTHLVRRGETLSKISTDYGVRVEDIKSASHLRSNWLSVGQRLVVPTSLARNWRRAAGRYREEDPVRGRARSGGVRRGTVRATGLRPAPVMVSPRGTPVRRMHVVKSGESLWTIANRAHVPVAALQRANGLTPHAVLRSGQVVRIPN
jgi:membrane-bound lytic murein transglycosylase D